MAFAVSLRFICRFARDVYSLGRVFLFLYSSTLMKNYLTEFIGTFFLVFTIALVVA